MTGLKTEAGKEIDIVVDNKTAHYKIQFKTGGELPQELTGLFTSTYKAIEAINRYLGNRKKTK